jgi:competence protein ComEA
MHDLSRTQLIIYFVAGLAALAFGVREVAASRAGDEPPSPPGEIRLDRDEDRAGGRVTVHVAGAVRRPGVYRLRAGARVDLAVRRAGGATRRGDLTQVNLAQELEDGRQIVVPARAAAGGAPAAAGSAAPTAPVNLNTATLEQLDALDGIGPVTAQSILDYRAEQGGFESVDELDQVPGIGAATLAAIREDVTA